MPVPLDFQSLLLALQTYWADRGCALLQGYDLEVGAGAMNPATFLLVLGAEPGNVAYGSLPATRSTAVSARTRTASTSTTSSR